jgi:hypothetical protein
VINVDGAVTPKSILDKASATAVVEAAFDAAVEPFFARGLRGARGFLTLAFLGAFF